MKNPKFSKKKDSPLKIKVSKRIFFIVTLEFLRINNYKMIEHLLSTNKNLRTEQKDQKYITKRLKHVMKNAKWRIVFSEIW